MDYNGGIMKDTKEIVLFFKEDTNFSLVDASHEILSRYPELGEPILFPDDGKTRAPLILFSKNPEIQMQIGRVSVGLVINHNYFKKLETLIFDMVDTFEGLDCYFYRIGYISSIFLSPDYVDKAKSKFFKIEELDGVSDFNLSWYRKIKLKSSDINCWERFITDSKNFNDLLIQYDFNTNVNETIKFEMKYIKDFVRTANDFIESRIDF